MMKVKRMRFQVLFCLLVMSVVALAEPWPQLPVKVNYENWVGISPKGTYALLDRGGDVHLWNAKKQIIITRFRDVERVLAKDFSPDGRHLAVSDYPRKLAVYDCAAGAKKVWEFRGSWDGKGDVQNPGTYDVLYSPNGKYLLAVGSGHGAQSGDSTVRIFDAVTGRVVFQQAGWGGRGLGAARNFCFTPDSKFLLRSAHDKLQKFALPSGNKVGEIRLGGDMYWMISTDSGALIGHNVENGTRFVERLYSFQDLGLLNEKTRDADYEFQPKGQLQWRRDAGRLQVAKGANTVYTGSEESTLSYWVPGAGFIVTSNDKDAELFDAEGRKLTNLSKYARLDGQLALECPGYGGPSAVYDLVSGKQLAKFAFAASMALSQDGKTLAVAAKNGVYLMDVPASQKAGVAVAKKVEK